MKPKTSHKLFAILAVSGLTWSSSAIPTMAQDGFGFVRPATAVKRPVVDDTPALPAQRIHVPSPAEVVQGPPVVQTISAQEAPPVMEFQAPQAMLLQPLPVGGSAPTQENQFQAQQPIAALPVSSPTQMELAPPAAAAPQVMAPTPLKSMVSTVGSAMPPQAQLLAPILDQAPAPAESKLPAGPDPTPTDSATSDAEMASAAPPQVDPPVDASRTPVSYGVGSLPLADEAKTAIAATAEMPSQVEQTPAAPVVLGQMPAQVDVPPIVGQSVGSSTPPPMVTTRTEPTINSIQPEYFNAPEAVRTNPPIPLVNAPPTPKGLDPAYSPGDLTPPPAATPSPRRRTRLGQNLFNQQDPVPMEMAGEMGYGAAEGAFMANGYDAQQVACQFQACGANSWARRYLNLDVLYFNRDDGFISNSNFGDLGSFDWNAGWRATIGRRTDSVWGRELSYMGTLPFEETQDYTSPTGAIQSRFVTADGLTPADASGFFNATSQSHSKETYFHSIEFNRVKWGWDVLKTYVGLRYFLIDDSYTLYSQSLANNQGFFQMEATNHLIGPQIGADLYYDVGRRFSFSLVSKLGVYGNANEMNTVMINDGTTFIDQENSDGTVSGAYEFGLNTHFRLSDRARLRGGYNFLWFGDVASVSDNFPRTLAPSTGADTDDEDDMFFQGFSFGIEIFR